MTWGHLGASMSSPERAPPDPFGPGSAAAEYAEGYVSEEDGLEQCGKPKRREALELTPGSRPLANKRALLPGAEEMDGVTEPPNVSTTILERLQTLILQGGELRGELRVLNSKVDAQLEALAARIAQLEQQRLAPLESTVKRHSDEISGVKGSMKLCYNSQKELDERSKAL